MYNVPLYLLNKTGLLSYLEKHFIEKIIQKYIDCLKFVTF